MKTLTTTSLIFVLLSFASHSSALPDCTDERETLDDCTGSYIWRTGIRYDGEFKNGLPHGKGAITYPNGDKYIGELKNGDKHGNGTFAYSNGSSYVGEFKNGKFNGKGTTTLTDGTIFIGEFKDNEMNGQGILWVEGREIRGIWADNKYLYESAESVDK